jgi:hypothetical protein
VKGQTGGRGGGREGGGRTHVVAGVVAGLVRRVDERELRERARRGAVVEDVLPLEAVRVRVGHSVPISI